MIALEINPKHSLAYSNLAIVYLDLDNIKEAYDNFKKAMDTEKGESINYFYLALCAHMMNKNY